jgi:hypothetical protein
VVGVRGFPGPQVRGTGGTRRCGGDHAVNECLRERLVGLCCAVPTGLAVLVVRIFPTLKRGANVRCAYGATGVWSKSLENPDIFPQ